MNLGKKEGLMKGLNLPLDLESFFNGLCSQYISNRGDDANYLEWLRYFVIFYSVSKEELKNWPSSYWRPALFEIMHNYFEESLKNSGPKIQGCRDYIRKNLKPW